MKVVLSKASLSKCPSINFLLKNYHATIAGFDLTTIARPIPLDHAARA
jgi:hypothetical protein